MKGSERGTSARIHPALGIAVVTAIMAGAAALIAGIEIAAHGRPRVVGYVRQRNHRAADAEVSEAPPEGFRPVIPERPIAYG